MHCAAIVHCPGAHNSDLRYSHEYIKKQVWGEFICTRQNSKKFDFLRTRLTEAVLIPFTSQFVYTRMSRKSELCLASYPSSLTIANIRFSQTWPGTLEKCSAQTGRRQQWTYCARNAKLIGFLQQCICNVCVRWSSQDAHKSTHDVFSLVSLNFWWGEFSGWCCSDGNYRIVSSCCCCRNGGMQHSSNIRSQRDSKK